MSDREWNFACDQFDTLPATIPDGGAQNAECNAITVIVVSDFETGEKDWRDEVNMAKKLAGQDIGQPIDVIFAEFAGNHNNPPPAVLHEYLPQAKVLFFDAETSSELKNMAMEHCNSPLVAQFEADSPPEPDWLRRMQQRAIDHPDCAFFTGRTHYGLGNSWQRVLNLIDRAFDDVGQSGETIFLSSNAAFFRTDIARQFPYPKAPTIFVSGWLRNKALLAAGHKICFDREALATHALEGFRFFWDVRRQTGFACYAMHGTSGWRDIPRLLRLRMNHDLENVKRVGRKHLKLLDWPVWLGLQALGRVPETLGMIAAMSAKPELRGTSFR